MSSVVLNSQLDGVNVKLIDISASNISAPKAYIDKLIHKLIHFDSIIEERF